MTDSKTEHATSTAAPLADPLDGLKKMSTTAGLGSGDYAAINPLSITTILLGIASLLTPVFDSAWLLLIPAAGVLCAMIAVVQIRASNGTQTGRGLAIAGALLSILIGGGTLGYHEYVSSLRAPEVRKISELIKQLGENVAAGVDGHSATSHPATDEVVGPFQRAYLMFYDKFQQRVVQSEFEAKWLALARPDMTGGVASIEWNGKIDYRTDTGSGAPRADVMSLVHYRNKDLPVLRLGIELTKQSGVWQFVDIPDLFPPVRTPRSN